MAETEPDLVLGAGTTALHRRGPCGRAGCSRVGQFHMKGCSNRTVESQCCQEAWKLVKGAKNRRV